jgi:hypothetical protein
MKRSSLLILALLAASACTSAAQRAPRSENQGSREGAALAAEHMSVVPFAQDAPLGDAKEQSPSSDRLRWRLDVTPNPMRMAQRRSCLVRVSVTNEGPRAVEPQLHLAQFTLDGQLSMGLSLAFSNGVMDRGWSSIPPGETATTERALCETLFPTPGVYRIGLRQGAQTSTVVVRVTP